MKTYIGAICLFFCSLHVMSQDKEMEIKAMMWNVADSDFSVTNAGERWKNESAVILCKSYDYRVKKSFLLNVTNENIYTHERVLLQDQAAVNFFSKLKFDYTKEFGMIFTYSTLKSYIGVKVIKPGGAVSEIDISKAAIDEFREGERREQVKKIAVPNLAIGDIVDYYCCTENEQNIPGYYSFSPVFYPLVNEYPILKNKVSLHIMRRCYLNAHAMNGAPKLTFDDDSKRSDMLYSLVDTCRDRYKEQIWLYPLRELPVLIFQAYTNNSKQLNGHYCFVDNEDVIKTSIRNDELLTFFNFHFTSANAWRSGKIYRNVKRICKNEVDYRVKLREAYYYMRQLYYFKDYDNLTSPGNFRYQLREYLFVSTLSNVLNRLQIPNSIVLTVPRALGTINDLIMPDQMGFLLKVEGGDPIYISNVTPFSLPNELDADYQGNAVKKVIASVDVEYRKNVFDDTIYQSKYDENTERTMLAIKFNPDTAEKLSIHLQNNCLGLQKNSYQRMFVTPSDYLQTCNNKYKLKAPEATDPVVMNKIIKTQHQAETDREKAAVNLLEYQFGIENGIHVQKFELTQPGMWHDAPELKYNIDFETENFISLSGENILIDAGKLIGVQVFNPAEDSVRKFDVYMNYARLYESEIRIAIPEGYAPKGIDKFSMKVETPAGGFISSAITENKEVVIKVRKYFVSNYYKKTDWPQIMDFVDAANEFRNQKLLFVKQ